jgi:threonine dehydratase
MDIYEEVLRAEESIRPYIRRTYLEPSSVLSQLTGAKVYVKLENLQYTGSFKFRGAMNKLRCLSEEERSRGVVTASTGNHGMAVAFGLMRLGARGLIFVPEESDPSKVGAIERMGAEVRYFGRDCVEAEIHARGFAAKEGLAYVPPYNDIKVVAGQGTIGVELAEQLEGIDAVFASLGGGGLISGISAYLKRVRSGIEIIGCSPENSKVMIESVKAGRILDLPSLPTLSDGTAGGLEAGSITFDLCREWVDDYETVTEAEIEEAFKLYMGAHHMLIEGAAAVAVASLLNRKAKCRGKKVVVIICGANIALDTVRRILH